MLKLLVSVVDEEDAEEASKGGADIIDVKNPLEGSLGANFPWVLSNIRRALGEQVVLSATIGDMPYLPGTACFAAVGAAKSGADYVKIGLYGPRSFEEALLLLRSVRRAVAEFAPGVKVIAGCYGDYHTFNGINPLHLPRLASEAGVEGILLDIRTKGEKKLFHYMNRHSIAQIVEDAHLRGLSVALAGGLEQTDIARARSLGADIFGVRRAVCARFEGGYGGVESERVREIAVRM